jgi:hypothetical protein
MMQSSDNAVKSRVVFQHHWALTKAGDDESQQTRMHLFVGIGIDWIGRDSRSAGRAAGADTDADPAGPA